MNSFNDLKNSWHNSKGNLAALSNEPDFIIQEAKKSKRKTQGAQIATIIILSITLLGLIAFFSTVARFQDLLSRAGVFLMCGGLLLRIVIEVISLVKSKKLLLDLSAHELTVKMGQYYVYRTKIHGAITYIILALYIIGFYMLTPEFMQHLAMKWVWLMDIGFVFIAVTLFYVIRKGVLEELAVLRRFKDARLTLNN